MYLNNFAKVNCMIVWDYFIDVVRTLYVKSRGRMQRARLKAGWSSAERDRTVSPVIRHDRLFQTEKKTR